MAENAGSLEGYAILPDRSFALSWPRYVCRRVLDTAGTAESVTVPSGATIAIFSGTADFAASYNQGGTSFTASMTGDLDDGTAAEINPTQRYISGVTSISLVSATAGCIVTVAFYRP